jgi:HEAT repeat protein
MKALLLWISMLALGGNAALASQTYSLVEGIDKFAGSASAWRLLETNGFVVADPAYQQIFEPYLDTSLPPFITIDSAWDTYQVLLAAGKKQLESNYQSDAAFFGAAIEPKIPGRATVSGLDFFVACPDLRSPAAVRALRQALGDKAEAAVENLNYSLPSDSLAAQSLRLLASLQKPVPDHLAPAFRSEAWADEQLWTQLGAWIEQNHPRQSDFATPNGSEATDDAPKKGVVAPYPDFFAGLAQLARQTEAAMEKAGMDEQFDSRATAQKLLDSVFLEQGLAADREDAAKLSAARIQFNQFAGRYMETHHAGGGDNSPAAQQLLKDLEAVARRCVAGTVPSAEDRIVLQGFFAERQTAPRLLRDFAAICDKLAELARKQVDGAPLTDDDEKWIADYGTTLARFHSFPGDSSTAAENDFPIIRRLGTNAAGASVLWAGLGHPEALYIILPAEGRLRLYRGAVLAYGEFVRPASDSSDEKSWERPAGTGNTPPAPPFTASFRAEKSAADILETLAAEAGDPQGYRDIQECLEALQSRVSDADLPVLIAALAKTGAVWSGSPVPDGIAAAIAKLNWKSSQEKLLALIDKDDGIRAVAVTSILLQRPEWLDGAALSANFDRSATRSRRVYALLLGRVQPTDQTLAALLRALHDDAPGVRWQAAMAVGGASWPSDRKIPPLLDRLNDSNELVAAVAAYGLGKIGAASVSPVLFSNLEQRLAAPAPGAAALQEQCEAVQDTILGNFSGQSNLFDPDNLLGRAQIPRMRRFAMDVRRDQFTDVTALIEALGDLHYQPAEDTILGLLDGRNASAAARALKKLAPEKLAGRLLTIAADKNALPQARDDALFLLSDTAGPNPMADLIPLLDDHTVVPTVRLMPGREWRICDRAATTLAALMGRTLRMAPMMPTEQRDQQIEQVRQWLKSAY